MNKKGKLEPFNYQIEKTVHERINKLLSTNVLENASDSYCNRTSTHLIGLKKQPSSYELSIRINMSKDVFFKFLQLVESNFTKKELIFSKRDSFDHFVLKNGKVIKIQDFYFVRKRISQQLEISVSDMITNKNA
ncbi:hypothetical protein UB39_20985 [Photobacterium angustum]|nr:hypothetical protein UB39_20985 [Photobacterium angustum]